MWFGQEDTPIKEGPNFEDCNRIREWAAEGLDAAAISQKVLVKPEAVQIYLDSLEEDKPKRTRKKPAATDADGTE